MFVREKKVKDIKYAYLVENHWNPHRKKYEQKMLGSLGKVTSLPESGVIEKMILALDSFAKKLGLNTLSDGVILSDLSVREDLLDQTYDFGILALTSHVLNSLGLTSILSRLTVSKLSASKFLATVSALVAFRLLPKTAASERSTQKWYTKEVYLADKPKLSLSDFYRSLDVLLAHKEEIETAYFNHNADLLTQNAGLDLVLFDTTTIHFWGKTDEHDTASLLQYGHAKNKRTDLKQLMVGALMTRTGIPIAHEVFPGNTNDTKTFAKTIQLVKDKYQGKHGINKLILVADRGMVSEENLITLEQSGLEYIVGVKMRTFKQSLQDKLLKFLTFEDIVSGLKKPEEDMETVNNHLFVKEFPVSEFTPAELKDLIDDKLDRLQKGGKTASFDSNKILDRVKNRRFFVCLNPSIAELMVYKREFFKKVIKNKIAKASFKEWVIKNGYRKYLEFPEGLRPKLDEERIDSENVFDGKWVVVTNNQNLPATDIPRYYQSLQTIERGFRDLKSLITVQPLYHSKEERMQAHIFVCFLALIVKWHICKQLNPNSQTEGREFLHQIQNLKAIRVDSTQNLYVRTGVSPKVLSQLSQLKMKLPGKIINQISKPKKHSSLAPKYAGQMSLLTTTDLV